jgi:putative inorganic carbon (HCO3(-)) transporter
MSITATRAEPGFHLPLALLGAVGVVIGAASVGFPLFVVGGILGLVYIVVALQSLAAGVALFTVLIFLERIPTVSSGVTSTTKLAGGVLVLAWLLAVAKRDPNTPLFARRLPVLAYSTLVLLCWMLASMLWATDSRTAGGTALRFAQGVALIFVVFSAVREPRHLKWIVYAFLVGAALSAVVGLAGVTKAEDANIDASRLTGGIGDPNELAAVLVPALSFALFMLVIERRVLLRWLLLAAALISALALFRTESRGGLVGLGVMLVASAFLSGPVRARAVTMALATSGFALVYFTLIAPPQALARVTTFSAGGGTGRPDLWAVALDVFRAHPLVGVGAGNFPLVEPSYAFLNRNLPRFDLIVVTPKVVHNTYLNVLVEVGVVGFILFAFVVVGAFAAALRAVRALARAGDLEVEILARGIIVGTIGMLAAFTFFSAQYQKQLPLLIALLAALSTVARTRSRNGGAAGAAQRGLQNALNSGASPSDLETPNTSLRLLHGAGDRAGD